MNYRALNEIDRYKKKKMWYVLWGPPYYGTVDKG